MDNSLIFRQTAIDAVNNAFDRETLLTGFVRSIAVRAIRDMPPAQPEKETPKRVLWSGWKGMRDTRYKCPNCKKPVRNTDIYCHRCGQKLMFPNISLKSMMIFESRSISGSTICPTPPAGTGAISASASSSLIAIASCASLR